MQLIKFKDEINILYRLMSVSNVLSILRFSDLFRGYRSGTSVENGLSLKES